MTIRFLSAILAVALIAPGAAPASTMFTMDTLAALSGPPATGRQCVSSQCPARLAPIRLAPIRLADDATVVVPDTCDTTVQAQCTYDCQILRADCETGHDDSLPCEANYSTCTSNCAVMAGCNN